MKHTRLLAALVGSVVRVLEPHWYYPVRQSLGAALLQQGRPDKAEREFRSALEQFPNNA